MDKTQPNMVIENLRQINPKLAEMTENTMDRLLTGTNTYDIENPDDIERDSGFIDKKGNWYSAEPMEHEPFADDYMQKHKMLKSKDKGLISCKDELVKDYGWIAVTVGAIGVYVLGGKFNKKQRQTIKKWHKKFKHDFEISDEDGNHEINKENHYWFKGGRE